MFTLGFFSDPGRRQYWHRRTNVNLNCQSVTARSKRGKLRIVYTLSIPTRDRGFSVKLSKIPVLQHSDAEQGDNQGRNRCRPGCSEGGVGE
jgi:hypothetical protein